MRRRTPRNKVVVLGGQAPQGVRRRANPRRGFALFSATLKIHPLLRFFMLKIISASTDADQGLCPWNPLPFLQRSKRKRKEALYGLRRLFLRELLPNLHKTTNPTSRKLSESPIELVGIIGIIKATYKIGGIQHDTTISPAPAPELPLWTNVMPFSSSFLLLYPLHSFRKEAYHEQQLSF